MATATLVLAANAPDIDMLSYFRGEYYALSFRRGITHGLPAMVVLPFIVAGVILAWDRWVRRRRDPDAEPARPRAVLALSVAGLITHPVLDWMNTYGMRWWLPFDGSWTYGDALFIIDPWIWLMLGGAVFLATSRGRSAAFGWGGLALLTSLLILAAPLPLGSAVRVLWVVGLAVIVGAAAAGRPESADGRRRLAASCTVAATCYILLMVGADLGARRDVAAAARAAGLDVRDLMVQPLPAHPLGAEVEVLTAYAFVPGTHSWFRYPRVELHPEVGVPLLLGPEGVDPAELHDIVSAARAVSPARDWLVWARYPYARVSRVDGTWWVTFRDARYDGREGVGGLAGVAVTVEEP